MTTLRFVFTLTSVVFSLCVIPQESNAWWSIPNGGDTHLDLTKDVLDNKLADETLHLDVDYPDLLRLKDDLENGSNMESHNIPDGLATEWWWPNKDQIIGSFFSGRIVDEQQIEFGALWAYTNYFFHSAYVNIGRELHLVQDQSVPAHKRYCCHGLTDFNWDDLEKKASVAHFYGTPKEDWTYKFVHKGGVATFEYWLDDSMDDDDEDDEACMDDELTEEWHLREDGPTRDWGVANTDWGTYGQPFFYTEGDHNYNRVLLEYLPGNSSGMDFYMESPDTEILFGQLMLAYNDTLKRLKERSEALPPLIPDDDVNGKPNISLSIFGPNKPVVIDFYAMENRKPTVFISVLAGSAGIRDRNTNKVWDGGANASRDLQPWDALPWKSHIICNWDGDTGTRQIADGEHVITMQVRDEDENLSEARTRSVKFDKTKPVAEPITISYGSSSY